MTDESELKLLREEIELQGPRSPSRRYPPELKRRILAWVASRQVAGVGRLEIAEAVGIPWETLTKWQRMAVAAQLATAPATFKPVNVVRARPPAKPSLSPRSLLRLTTPRGFVVDGLDLRALTELLLKLG